MAYFLEIGSEDEPRCSTDEPTLHALEHADAFVRATALSSEQAVWWWLAHRTVERSDDLEARERECARLRSGELLLVLRGRPRGQTAYRPDLLPAQPLASLAPTIESKLESISFRVLDENTAEPIAGVQLVVVLPDGSEQQRVTNGDGIVELRQLLPGPCEVRSPRTMSYLGECLAFVGFGAPPRAGASAGQPGGPRLILLGRGAAPASATKLVDLLEHRVRDGDTWASVAAPHGLGAEDLMRFNFDTTDPTDIQVAMARHVGCWRRDPANGELVFGSRDRPGILLVPIEWKRGDKDTGFEHVLRVRRIAPPVRPYLFSA